jgi:hypothetical protein
MAQANQLGSEWQDVLTYYSDDIVKDSFDRLARYAPDVMDGYITLRRATAKEPPAGQLSPD